MISLLSLMSALIEAPEDILNYRIIAFARKGLSKRNVSL
jgi:hypothetical protein